MKLSSKGMMAWRAFLEAHAHVTRELERDLRRDRHLPLAWYDALVQLHEAGGSLRMHELADRTLLSRSATTRFADRLEEAGLIERKASEDDRRGTVVTLTDAGVARLRDATSVHLEGVQRYFARHLDDDEASALTTLMQRMLSTPD